MATFIENVVYIDVLKYMLFHYAPHKTCTRSIPGDLWFKPVTDEQVFNEKFPHMTILWSVRVYVKQFFMPSVSW